ISIAQSNIVSISTFKINEIILTKFFYHYELINYFIKYFFFSSRRRHTRSVSAFLLNRSSDLVPEYGTANGRLHFHAVHFMRTLPTGSVDPNFGRRVRNRRQLNSLQNTWPYGYSMPIAVRYTQDAFSRSGWLWPVDA